MGKEKKIDLDQEEDYEEEPEDTEEQVEETKTEPIESVPVNLKAEMFELVFSDDPIERLAKELKVSVGAQKTIGKYLLNAFKEDTMLASDYKEKKRTLGDIYKAVYENAQKELNNENGAIEDKVVFGWVNDYIRDGKITNEEKSYIITNDDLLKAEQELAEQVRRQALEQVKSKTKVSIVLTDEEKAQAIKEAEEEAKRREIYVLKEVEIERIKKANEKAKEKAKEQGFEQMSLLG